MNLSNDFIEEGIDVLRWENHSQIDISKSNVAEGLVVTQVIIVLHKRLYVLSEF